MLNRTSIFLCCLLISCSTIEERALDRKKHNIRTLEQSSKESFISNKSETTIPTVNENTGQLLGYEKLQDNSKKDPDAENIRYYPANSQIEVYSNTDKPRKTEQLTLNFNDADIRDVIKTVLGDIYKLNYVISPNVQTKITLSLADDLDIKTALSVLESVFQLYGIAILPTDGLIKILPMSEAPHLATSSYINGHKPAQFDGFGSNVIQLTNINASEVKDIISAVSNSAGVSLLPPRDDLLIIYGNSQDRIAMQALIKALDIDSLSGKNVGYFTITHSTSKDIAKELQDIFQSNVGKSASGLKIIPLSRVNAVIVITPSRDLLDKVREWLVRLDIPSSDANQDIWVYSVQNGRAADIGNTLKLLLSAPLDVPPKNIVSPKNEPFEVPPINNQDLSDQVFSQQNISIPDGTAKIKIVVDEMTNSLLISGAKEKIYMIQAVLNKLDIPPMQVQLEAVIAEVSLNDDLSYGVQYLFSKHGKGVILTNSSSSTSISSTLPGFSSFISKSDIKATLDLLQSVTDVNVLSSPQLLVINNQTASLQVGEQVPISTQTSVSVSTNDAPVVNSIQMKDTGVIMKVTPRVNTSGLVVMDVLQEVSDVVETTSSSIDSPTIQQRKILTSIAVEDGQTIVLGGLIKDNKSTTKDGIPFLQDIPVLGAAFGSTTTSHNRTELIALITPKVLKNTKNTSLITDEILEKMNGLHHVIGSQERAN